MNREKLTHEEIVTKVMEALDSIRPFLNNDGGDIELVDVVDNKDDGRNDKVGSEES
jgi:Fe-S cluster biogenesis protein NfuA